MTYDDFLRNERVQFWGLQLIGWGGWGVTWYASRVYWGNVPDHYNIYIVIVSALGMLISMGLRALYRATWDADLIRRGILIVVGSWLAAALWMVCRSYIFELFTPPDLEMHQKDGLDQFFSMIQGITTHWFVMLCWSGLYVGIKYYKLLQEMRERGIKAELMAHEAQLKMLRYQLNPHFLFNTLNAISTLILDKENQLANTMVTRLSHFLRYTLDNDPMQKVTLAQEVEALKLYLDIEKVRFDERLQLHFDIAAEAQQARIPSLLLQPIVENSIKYAIAQSIKGGTISISARRFGQELLLEASDDGPGLDPGISNSPKRIGVGLANIRERLRELYDDNQSFALSPTDPHGVTVNIRIPFEIEDAP
jgi:two-component system LytT family sensor kinase